MHLACEISKLDQSKKKRVEDWYNVLKGEQTYGTHSRFSGALIHSETWSQSESMRVKFHTNSPGTSYGLSMQSTFISFPNNGASSSTISSSSISSTLEAEGLRPKGGEAERDSEERFAGLETPVRVPRTAIGGGEGEVREIFMSLSD
jgi:hypothetical protein